MKDVTFTDSETPATFHRGVAIRKSFKKFAKPFNIKKIDRLSLDKGVKFIYVSSKMNFYD